MKIIVFISGMIYIALAFLIDKIGGIWQVNHAFYFLIFSKVL